MIRVTRMNGEPVVVNADLIEFVEMTPDTLLSLLTGKKVPVRESAEDVIDRVISYRRSINAGAHPPVPLSAQANEAEKTA